MKRRLGPIAAAVALVTATFGVVAVASSAAVAAAGNNSRLTLLSHHPLGASTADTTQNTVEPIMPNGYPTVGIPYTGYVFYRASIGVDVSAGMSVVLASTTDGTGSLYVDDELDLTITGPSGEVLNTATHDYSNGCQGFISSTPPWDITSLLQPGGINLITFSFHDVCGNQIDASPFFMVTDNQPVAVADPAFNALPVSEFATTAGCSPVPAALSTYQPPSSLPSNVALPLSTSTGAAGSDIVDADGDEVHLAAVNWYGAEEADSVPAGLDRERLDTIADEIAAMGFNAVRLPWSNYMVECNPLIPAGSAAVAANPQFGGQRAMAVFDAVVNALTARGVMVILDDHNTDPVWCCGDSDADQLWWSSKAQPYASTGDGAAYVAGDAHWLNDWMFMAGRYVANPFVVGADLRNEPRGATEWSDPSDPSLDWSQASTLGGDMVQAVNPNLISFVEGTNFATDLTDVSADPVELNAASRLVYEAHRYSWEHCAGDSDTASGSQSESPFAQCLDQDVGYVAKTDIAPVFVGEFGTSQTTVCNGGNPNDWFPKIQHYLEANDFGWADWAVNGTEANGGTGSGRSLGTPESFGVLAPDWSSVEPWLLASLTTSSETASHQAGLYGCTAFTQPSLNFAGGESGHLTQTATFQNQSQSGASVTVTDVTITGPGAAQYKVAGNSCSGAISAAGGHNECDMTIKFTPATTPTSCVAELTAYNGGVALAETLLMASTAACPSPIGSFITAAYNDFLGTNPSPTVLDSWSLILSVAHIRSPLPVSLANSAAWIKHIIDAFYQQTLGRPADASGLAYWTQQISSGAQTVAQVAADFYASDEYFNRSGDTIAGWITALYQAILKRSPDPGGVTYWSQQTRATGRQSVAYSFYQSLESRQDRVEALYQQLLGRPADTAGLAYWSAQLLRTGDITLAINLASSYEYYARAQMRFP